MNVILVPAHTDNVWIIVADFSVAEGAIYRSTNNQSWHDRTQAGEQRKLLGEQRELPGEQREPPGLARLTSNVIVSGVAKNLTE